MEEKFEFLELKIMLKDGNTVSAKVPGTIYINDRYVFYQIDRIRPAGFRCGFIPWDMICHIGFD